MAILTNSFFLDVGLLLVSLVGALHFYFSRNYRKWEKKGIPFLKPLPFVGNCMNMVLGKESIGDVFRGCYKAAKGKPLMGMFAFDQPLIVVRDLELVKKMLVKDFSFFMDRNLAADKELDPLLARSLFSMQGEQWKHVRANLSPTFTSGKMKKMFIFVDESGKELVKYIDKYSADGRLEIKETMAKYTTDVIASCAFGIQSNALSEPANEFRQMLRKIFDTSVIKSIAIAINFTSPALLSFLKLKSIDGGVEDYIRNTVWNTVEFRKKNGVVRNDFLDLLLQLKEKGRLDDDEGEAVASGKKFELEGDDFVAQAFAFLSAGFETSSTTITYALYELALHPDFQIRLRQEIQTVLEKNGGRVTYDGIQEMKYLDMVVSETLRKYPVLPFLDRRVQQPYTIPGTNIQLDKGDVAIISLSGIHSDPEHYPEPQRFDPERFTEENCRTRHNYAYMPFGEGPRICIGMRMGLMQTKVGLVHFINNFEVRPCKDTPVPMEFDERNFFIAAKGTVPLSVKRIKTSS